MQIRILIATFIIYIFIIGTPIMAQENTTSEENNINTIEPSEKNSNLPPEGETPKEDSSPKFHLSIVAGIDVLDYFEENYSTEIFQTMGLQSSFEISKFSFCLNLQLRYRFINEDDTFIEILDEDWVPDFDNGETILDVYLPKIDYIRWGTKEDALFANIDQIYKKTLGTGFVVNNYSNYLFQIHEQIVGLVFDMDGQFFDFPYFGIESMVGNIARFDVIAARLYSRPFHWATVPVIENLEIGFTFAADTDPDLRAKQYFTPINEGAEADAVVMYNGDIILPFIDRNFLSLALSGNFCYQNKHIGGDIELGGRLFSIVPYNFKLRMFGDNFIPSYFDYSYDIYRGQKYDIYHLEDEYIAIDNGQNWEAGTGLFLFGDKLNLSLSLNGPFDTLPEDEEMYYPEINYLDFIHLHLYLNIEKSIIPNLSITARYDKMYINELSDLTESDNSILDFILCYSTDIAKVYLEHKWCYSKDDDAELTRLDYKLSTSIYCSFRFF